MPVTAKLSRAFYERLGDDIANELVEWFNSVDLTYRTELRELNELNFARFDAKVGERLAELRSELLSEMDARFAKVEVKFAELRTELQTELQVGFRAEMDARFARVDDRFTKLSDQIRESKESTLKWMFGFWIGTGAMVIGWLITRWLTT